MMRSMDSDRTHRSAESNTSETDMNPSEDEISQDKTSVSGSLEMSALTKKGTINYSERNDISDDLESRFDDDNTDEHTSIEILESANSISEQTEEDDEDDMVGVYPLKTRGKLRV